MLWVNFDLDRDDPERIKRFLSITTSDFYPQFEAAIDPESTSGLPTPATVAVRLRRWGENRRYLKRKRLSDLVQHKGTICVRSIAGTRR